MEIGSFLTRTVVEDRISELCYEKYSELGKNGKPCDGQWTLLSGFIVEHPTQDLKLVSLATGTKCIGKSKMSSSGSVLNDSHSEVLSRRGLLRYLYENIEEAQCGSSSLFELSDNGKFNLMSDVGFHFFCSHVPCGDASIIPMLKRKACDDNICDKRNKKPKTRVKSDCNEETKMLQLEKEDLSYDDVYRTGGKCVARQDPYGLGHEYHTLGAVRTKPGRGEPTLSLSCSDKITKWIYCGVQGALLSLLLNEPIYLKSITVGGGGQFCVKAMERALINRCNSKHPPIISQSTNVFQNSRYLLDQDSNPCATSIIWSDVKNKPLEVSVDGRRLGFTKKCKDSVGRLKVSKMELFIRFIQLTGDKFKGLTYKEVKDEAKTYYSKFSDFKKSMGTWSTKPDLLSFLPDI